MTVLTPVDRRTRLDGTARIAREYTCNTHNVQLLTVLDVSLHARLLEESQRS